MASGISTAERKVALVVHDEPAIRRLIASILDEAAFDVIQVNAIAAARNGFNAPIDVVIVSDGVHGRELVDQLRRTRPALKTLTLTDRRERGDADAVLHVPFQLDDLREAAIALAFGRCRCASCLRRRAPADGTQSTESTNSRQRSS